jgi:hypothetical protein
MRYSIITDFSKTLTRSDGKTSWSLFAQTGILGDQYIAKREKLFEEYHPYESAGNKEKVSEWFLKHCELMRECGAVEHIPRLIKISREQ